MRHAVSTPMKRATILVLAAVCAACDPGGDGKPELVSMTIRQKP